MSCETGCNCRTCGPRRRGAYDFEYDDEADEVLTIDGVELRNNYDDGSEGT